MRTFRKMMAGLLVFAGFALVFNACQKDPVTEPELQNGDVIPGKYIVVYHDDITQKMGDVMTYEGRVEYVRTQTVQMLDELQISREGISQVYGTAIQGFAGEMSEAEAEMLQSDPRIKSVEPDHFVMLDVGILKKPTPPAPDPDPDPEPSDQVTPWGITRVGGGAAYTGNSKAWVIDTGIDLNHPDLNVNTTLSKTFVLRTTTAEDDNGHGSHVAGTIAAYNNSIGVVGVAAGAQVVAVKVLDRRGSGSYSAIIEGIDYVADFAAPGDVANMSLGGPASDALDGAVLALAAAGVKVALAAGNESQNANNVSPARVNHANVYTVSAFGTGDVWAYFSNYGNPPVDYAAPGVNINSCYKNGGYTTMSGTSMASPHMAGLLLGTFHIDGYVNGDPDNDPDPIAHK